MAERGQMQSAPSCVCQGRIRCAPTCRSSLGPSATRPRLAKVGLSESFSARERAQLCEVLGILQKCTPEETVREARASKRGEQGPSVERELERRQESGERCTTACLRKHYMYGPDTKDLVKRERQR